MLRAHIHDDAPCHPDLRGKIADITDRRSWGAVLEVDIGDGKVAPVRLEHQYFTLIPGDDNAEA